MAILKQFLKSKPECKVTFSVEAKNAKSVTVAGTFNNWQAEALPLKKMKNGTFKGSVNLPVENSFEFKYVIDNSTWINDEKADLFVANDFGEENGVIQL